MRSKRSPARGAGLIEVLVAAFVLSVGILGMAGVHAAVLRQWNGLVVRHDAQLRLRTLADSLDHGNLPVQGERGTSWGSASWVPEPPGIGLEARAERTGQVVARLWTRGPGNVAP